MTKYGAQNLLLVGCGKMGSALYEGWKRHHPALKITLCDPHNSGAHYHDLGDIHEQFDLCVLAVKPDQIHDVAARAHARLNPHGVLISIAAGKTLKNLEALSHATSTGQSDMRGIVRVMPNTPAAIGHGMSVAVANDYVTGAQKDFIGTLFQSVGRFAWIEDETFMDAVTALSGSGPAYLFYFIEALAEAGESLGLDRALSLTLARETIFGSAHLAAQASEDAAQLRKNVTSPGGTTEAALKVLMDENTGLAPLLRQTLEAARNRGREMGKTPS
ncbi:MAG: pyrroline-5-carboxylate reductase [Alphaproteobacteria bacterium]|nr:pyrroline-5-carboxylate reductase [Alphaproteobacteria bacterium]